ncbi:hypothetical protein [Flavivirga rizhaonensis]|uniref:Uncharacterized protein n=1 Tax=Flavivirga rizhaonensis TaxID=2559571 RepID=A0A4S1DU61_9FLAO|nr:hypothetical protein [Flavivirga rizhaonensis]TGV01586.1 hypothetical protein EM932_15000 [Flavivirga rizhaonensis]
MKLVPVLNRVFRSFKINKPLLILLIGIDLIFISAHCLLLFGIIDYNLDFSIEKDFGYAEFYQYIKEFGIFLILIFLFYEKEQIIYLVWAMFFLYVLLDDSLSLHEVYGVYLADYFNFQPKFNLRAEDFGELLIFLSIGVLFFISIIFAFFKTDLMGRLVTRNLFILILILAFFAIFVDQLHIMVPSGKNKFAVLEDGGEMLIMSFIFIYALSLKHTIKSPITY